VFADETMSRRGVVLRILLVLVAAGALVAIGRLTASDHHPVRFVAGVPVGYPRSETGARAAAATYATTRAQAILLEPAARRHVLDAIAIPAFARTADREDQARDLAPLAGQEQARYLVAALGTTVDAFTQDRARVTVWLLQALASDRAVGSFLTQTVELEWVDGDWRLAGQADSRVQAVPEITQAPRHADSRRLAARLQAPTYGRP
jgi:hypothetical protein